VSLQSSFRKRWLGRHDTPRSPHKEHGPKGKGHQGAGQAVLSVKLQRGIASIFYDQNEGATIFSKAPPMEGFGVHIAGDRNKIRRGFDIYDVDDTTGIWEGDIEDSFYIKAPEKNSHGLLSRAIHAGYINNQNAVLVAYRGADDTIRQQISRDYKFKPATNVQIHTNAGVVDLIDPNPDKVRRAVALARKQVQKVKVTKHSIMTRLLEKGVDY